MQLKTLIWDSKIHRYSVLTALVLLVTTGAVYGIYFNRFAGKGWGDQGDFGTFGDFVGGVLNPLLSSATIILLVLSFRVQSKQVSQAKEAHDVEIEVARQERRRHQLEEFAEYHFDQLDQMYDRPIYFSFAGLQDHGLRGAARYSMRDLYFTSHDQRSAAAIRFLMQLSEPQADEVDPVVRGCARRVAVSNDFLFKVIKELMPLVASQTIRHAWRDRYFQAMEVAYHLGIVGEYEHRRRDMETMAALVDPASPQ